MNVATRMPEVLDQLIATFKAATVTDEHPEGIQVTDGPHIGEVMYEAIVVGFTDGPDRPGYNATVSRQPGMGAPRLQEDFTVRSLLTLTSGDTDIRALRNRAGELLGLIGAALAGIHVKDGVWERATLNGDTEWIPIQHPDGATVNVFFQVDGSSLL